MPVELAEPVDPRAMLESDLALAEAELKNYQTHAHLAGSLGEAALKLKLEAIAADEVRHIQVLRQQLTRIGSCLAVDLPETIR
jgi:bacterioferritin (cytochrome b1)